MLVAENLRLEDLLDALGEYRSGYLGLDPRSTNPDDYKTQPIGGAGERIACGVIP